MRLTLDAVWGARKEGPESCAARLGCWLSACGRLFSREGQWFQARRRLDRAERFRVRIDDAAGLCEMIGKRQHRDDLERKPIPQLGYRVSLWNGEKGAGQVCVEIGCGVHSVGPDGRVLVFNFIEVDCVDADVAVADVDRWADAVAATGRCWETDRVCVGDRQRVPGGGAYHYAFVPWMWLSSHAAVRSVPVGRLVVDDERVVVIARERPPRLSEEADMAVVRRLREMTWPAGWLEPMGW